MHDRDLPIKLMTSDGHARDASETKAATEALRSALREFDEDMYLSAKMRIVRRADGSPDHLTVYLMRKDTYGYEVIRVDVTEGYGVRGTTRGYDDAQELEGP